MRLRNHRLLKALDFSFPQWFSWPGLKVASELEEALYVVYDQGG